MACPSCPQTSDEVFNLTSMNTPDTRGSGVGFPTGPGVYEAVRNLLTFATIPAHEELLGRAIQLAQIAADAGAKHAMIGDVPSLVIALDSELRKRGVTPVYPLLLQETVEDISPDGVRSSRIMRRHAGFVTYDRSVVE